jgi:hypothetical protein
MKPVRSLQGETPIAVIPEDPARFSRSARTGAFGPTAHFARTADACPRIAKPGMIAEDVAMPGLTSTVSLA